MPIWKAQNTLLLVGEGADEAAFLSHLKALYITRYCGLSVTIKNARGKGAKHVVDWTARQIAHAAYDTCAALLDTDTDFSLSLTETAEAKGIILLKSDPCLEAMLLRILGENLKKDLKKQFAHFVNHDATVSQHYGKHFTIKLLEDKRKHESTLDTLLKLLNPQ